MTSAPDADDLINALSQLGFGQYEARAYCALLASGSKNGHEVARLSGIPPSKIYETLTRLAEKGAVLISRVHPVLYAASPYETVLEAARLKFQRAFDTAHNSFKQVPKRGDSGQIWSLRETDTVLTEMTALIHGAKQRLIAALWDEELRTLTAPLEEASLRGCEIDVAVYGTAHLVGPRSYDLTLCGKSAADRLGGERLSAVVADGRDAIVASFRSDGSVQAISTDDPTLSLLAIEYVRADVLGRILINELGQERFEAMRYETLGIDRLLKS